MTGKNECGSTILKISEPQFLHKPSTGENCSMGKYGRSSIKLILRRTPTPVLITAVILLTLCPLALRNYSSGHHSPDSFLPVEDPGPVKSDTSQQWPVPVLIAPEIHNAIPRIQKISCPAARHNIKRPDFDLANLTYTLTDLSWDGDEGIWDEDMEANYQKQIKLKRKGDKKPLQVYIVPFSHADPGWLNTVEEYFSMQTKLTLDNMLKYLLQWPDMTFIWAEVSYFKMWWETLDEQKRSDTLSLVNSGRLEIVNGGYVMPDEATCHQYAILHQYIYGHQWLMENIGRTPEHGFSIDPFGHSSSMPYFLKNLDFKTMFIQRIHYNLRHHLGQHNATEFMWEQRWETTSGRSSIFTHLAPHHLYTIRNICGLNQGNCYFFDFKDISFEIQKSEMENQAKILMEEIRKTASLYPHNVYLYILGDDFRWAEEMEWTNQYKNFKLLMEVINGDPANRMVLKFGTLKNYYDAVFEETGSPETPLIPRPNVQGDFFPYADKFQDYWTGYFTSRPFYKQMSRELERDLRTAEILLVLAKMEHKNNYDDFHEDLVGLERAAESLGLFQHHDAITGTSKAAVAMDYGFKLQNGLLMAHAVILKNVFRLANLVSRAEMKKANIVLDSYRPNAPALPAKSPLTFMTRNNMERRVFIFNPLFRSRTTVIHLHSETPNLLIKDANGREILYQVSPALNDVDTKGLYLGVLRITFFIELEPLSMKSVSITSLGERSKRIKVKSRTSTTILTSDMLGDKNKILGFPVKRLNDEPDIVLQNEFMSAVFRPDDGMLQAIKTATYNQQVVMNLKRYETQSSGAYLFRPTGIADLNPYPHVVRVLSGHLFSEVQTITSAVVLTIRMYHSTATDIGKSLETDLITDMSNMPPNSELVLRLSTDIRNKKTFYTDSNGFQTIERRVSQDLPLSANYYPATTHAFLQDKSSRLTFHLTQAHGVGSQRTGELEVMIDRFLMQDDGRGVGEALRDQRVVKTTLQILLEHEGFCMGCPIKNPTDTATSVNFAANNPPFVTIEQEASNLTTFHYQPTKKPLPCDVHLLMLKPVTYRPSDRRVGFVFHKHGQDCSSSRTDLNVCVPGTHEIFLGDLLKQGQFKSYNDTSLNFATSKGVHPINVPINLEPMTLRAFTTSLP